MLILIYGLNGWIGGQVKEYLESQKIQYIEGKERVNDYGKISSEIFDTNCTHVLSLIGRTHGMINGKEITTIDYLEEDGKLVENIRDNLYSPLNLALICKRFQVHYTYLGTGCIFEYKNEDDTIGFYEDDDPNFFGSSYSIVKGFTDKILRNMDVLNLRIRMPITGDKNPRNFITKITSYEKICSISNSMSVLPELIPYMINMMISYQTGTFNFTNPGVISHNEILELYKEIVDPLFTWKNFTIEEQNTILKSKRSNNKLDTNRLQNLFPDILDIRSAVIKCLKSYPKPQYDFTNSKDTCILVTGGCGFIGSHFINYIWGNYENIQIVNIDAMYYNSNEMNVIQPVRKSNRYSLLKMNLNDIDKDILEQHKVNFIIHFAAQSHVQNSFEEPLQYTYDNVLGTVKLLEVTREYGKIKKFVHVSTDEVYGESNLNDDDKKHELSLLCPTNPYSGTKAAAELIAQTYISSFKLPIVISRGNNVFGIGQYPEKVIPKFIELLQSNKKVTIQGDGSATRSFLYIDDTVSAFDVILNKGQIGEVYNIGTDEGMEFSILEIAKILISKIQKTEKYEEWIEYIPDRPFNDQRYFISNNKLKKLGWNITTKFLDGLDIILQENKKNE
jgi:dTDP-glucose 4,6-dehydratase